MYNCIANWRQAEECDGSRNLPTNGGRGRATGLPTGLTKVVVLWPDDVVVFDCSSTLSAHAEKSITLKQAVGKYCEYSQYPLSNVLFTRYVNRYVHDITHGTHTMVMTSPMAHILWS